LLLSFIGSSTAFFAVEAERTFVKNRQGEKPVPIRAIEGVCSWPKLTVLEDRAIVAMIFNATGHGLEVGDVECWASEDEGRTWKKRGMAAPRGIPNANRMEVAAGLAGDGDLIVLIGGFLLRNGPVSSGRRQMLTKNKQIPGHLLRLLDGRLILSYGNRSAPKRGRGPVE
jgi:hypothetical protein